MEKNNTTTSTFSICRKIRQVFATNPAFKTINRMKQRYHEPKPQQLKIVKIEGGGNGGGGSMVPIMFDYSMVDEHAPKATSSHVGISERKGDLVTDSRLAQSQTVAKIEPNIEQYDEKLERKGKLVTDTSLVQSKSVVKVNPSDQQNVNIKQRMIIGENYKGKPLKVGLVNLEKQGKKSLDINDAFSEYIEREKNRIRTVSNVGKGQNNSVLEENNSLNKMENLNDQFSDFIVKAKKRIRTTSNVGKASSMKRG